MIKELKRITDFPSDALKPGDLVIFDVDQVIIDPIDGALSARGESIKSAQLQAWQRRLGVRQTNHLYSIWVQARAVKLVEADFLQVFERHRRSGLDQMVLSAFPSGAFGVLPDAAHYRRTQLESLGLDFSTSIYNYPSGFLQDDAWHGVVPGRRPLYAAGLMLTGQGGVGAYPISKGEVFRVFAKSRQLAARKLWFIDDGVAHVESMQAMCTQLDWPFQGFVYRHAYQGPKIDDALARFQFAYLEAHEVWLDDVQARQLVSEQRLD